MSYRKLYTEKVPSTMKIIKSQNQRILDYNLKKGKVKLEGWLFQESDFDIY